MSRGPNPAESATVMHYAITVEGIVQGVGFRPFVYRLASRLGLRGSVRNDAGAVRIEAEGERGALEGFLEQLVEQAPPLARIEQLAWERQTLRGEPPFRIDPSRSESLSGNPLTPPLSPAARGEREPAVPLRGPFPSFWRGSETPPAIFVSPDVATCAACVAELLDRHDRRYGYPFINCTHCGPRLTIITGAPYDRPQTTMASFPLCDVCREEYEDPLDRRFHAQPIACPVCGPRLELRDAAGQRLADPEPLSAFAEQIRTGRIGALKGLGGYHLVCLAEDATAVAVLRQRKHREEKPFAIMVADLERAAQLCEVDAPAGELLSSPRAPIVLLRRRGASPLADAVAPNHPWLGVMLPYTPLHHRLLRELGGAPLVMTSGNRSDEPIAYRDNEVFDRLRGIADVFLTHTRPIHVRCDDSVTRLVGGIEVPLRRSRGYAPQPVQLGVQSPRPILAVGGQLKCTFALGRGRQALISHHLGDLDHFDAYRAFERDIELYQRLFAVRPERIAHDLHPDYASTRYAQQRAARDGVTLFGVQHHHAHMASCMVDNALSLTEPVIGVTFDGTGLGTDGAVWGGEFLVGDCRGFRRAAHLRYTGMPGGEQAIREPWRMAAAHLLQAGVEASAVQSRVPPVAWRTAERMLQRRLNCPDTSSMGRLFDAVAAIMGMRMRTSYEGQAAVELEGLAEGERSDGSYPFEFARDGEAPLLVDPRPLIRAVTDEVRAGVDPRRVARRFHASIVEMIAHVCQRLRETTGLDTVVLSGGVFLNALLTEETTERLQGEGFQVYRHRQVPPGDGGLSLGQLAIATVEGLES